MTRRTLMILAAVALIAAAPARVRAQIIEGGLFPGSTPLGDALRGEGVALQGAGLFNLYTAQAESIHVDTAMRLNEYIYWSIKFENSEKNRRRKQKAAERHARHEAIGDRIENNPNRLDLEKGDTLNSLMDRLLDPKISPSSYRSASVPIDAEKVRGIPFFYGPRNAIISMTRLWPRVWPVGLRGPELAVERRNYERALDEALDRLLDGTLSREAILAVEAAVADLSTQFDRVVPPSRDKVYVEARAFLVDLERSKETMKLKDVEQILGELDSYSGTTVYDLVTFMQRNHLRFGVPKIGDELGAYPKLHASMSRQLEELEAALKDDGK